MRIDLEMKPDLIKTFEEVTGFSNFPPVTGISIDSRNCMPGDLYIALSGERVDGHEFLPQAQINGCIAALVHTPDPDLKNIIQIPVNDPLASIGRVASTWRTNFSIPVIGITGSNGKTSTKELLAHVLNYQYVVHSTKGNYNTSISLPLTLLQLNQKHEISVLEMGASAPGEIQYLCQISQPTIGLITNIAPAHLEGFGSIESIIYEKGSLFNALKYGIAFKNCDDPNLQNIEIPGRSISFGTTGNCEYSFEIVFKNDSYHLVTDEIILDTGSTNISFAKNCMAVTSIAHHLGLSFNTIQSGILTAEAPQGRCQVRQIGSITVIDDTYNANLESSLSAIDFLLKYSPDRRKFIIFGDMKELGDESESHHRLVGVKASQKGIHGLFTIGKDSKFTHIEGKDLPICRHFTSQDEMADGINEFLQPDDLILIKGSRGMAMETIISMLETV